MLLLLACSPRFEPSGDDPEERPDTGPIVDTGDSDSAPPDSETAPDSDSPPDTDPDSEPDSSVPDRDGDGSPDDADCNPDDPGVYPGAPELWYDGVDQDCDGHSDYDQDFDGHDAATAGGDDCDDLDAASFPGAADEAYDGVDADCAGDSDYDLDQDGYDYSLYGGDDCDDNNPEVSPGALEVLDDGLDSDCDGDGDRFLFYALDTLSGSGLHGPRIGLSNGEFVVAMLADELSDGSSTYTTGAVVNVLDAATPTSVATVEWWSWGSGTTWSDGFDFWADDDWWVYAYALHDGDIRQFAADVWRSDRADSLMVYYADNTENLIDDIEITEAADGSLHLVGCDTATGGYTWWVHAEAAAFYLMTDIHGDSVADPSDACSAWPQGDEVWVGRRAAARVDRYPVDDSRGFGTPTTDSSYAPYDLKVLDRAGHEGLLVAQGTGVEVELDGTSTTLPFTDARKMAATVDVEGRLWLAVVDDGALWLYWGVPGSSFSSMELDGRLADYTDLDVEVSPDAVLVVVRGADSVYAGALALY